MDWDEERQRDEERRKGHWVRGFALLTDRRNYETRENGQYQINGLNGMATV